MLYFFHYELAGDYIWGGEGHSLTTFWHSAAVHGGLEKQRVWTMSGRSLSSTSQSSTCPGRRSAVFPDPPDHRSLLNSCAPQHQYLPRFLSPPAVPLRVPGHDLCGRGCALLPFDPGPAGEHKAGAWTVCTLC